MKKALIIIGAVIALFLIVTALLPSAWHVERSIQINAPVDLVFDQVVDLEKNFNWSPWTEKDPEMQVTWGEIKKGVGASYSWSGNSDVGSGTQTITEVKENELIKDELDFGDMGKGTATWMFESKTSEDGSTSVNVTWAMDAEAGWPIGRIFGMMMDGMLGPDFENGLAKLKTVTEALPVEPEIAIELVDVMEVTMLSITDSLAIDQIGPKMGEMYGEIMGFMKANKLEVMSSPVCVYYVWNQEGGYTVMEAGIPILKSTSVKPKGRVKLSGIQPCQAAMAVHTGSYEGMEKTHVAIDTWITENGKEIAGAPWEVYVTDPQTEPDTSKWQTEIYYPVK